MPAVVERRQGSDIANVNLSRSSRGPPLSEVDRRGRWEFSVGELSKVECDGSAATLVLKKTKTTGGSNGCNGRIFSF